MGTIITTPDGIAYAQLCAQILCLKMEIKGLKRRGRSVYSIVKQQYNLKGTRESVFQQLMNRKDLLINEQGRRSVSGIAVCQYCGKTPCECRCVHDKLCFLCEDENCRTEPYDHSAVAPLPDDEGGNN